MTIATRESWNTNPLPEQYVRLTANWTHTREEFEQMKGDFIPEVMEDKLFIYHDLDGCTSVPSSWMNRIVRWIFANL